MLWAGDQKVCRPQVSTLYTTVACVNCELRTGGQPRQSLTRVVCALSQSTKNMLFLLLQKKGLPGSFGALLLLKKS